MTNKPDPGFNPSRRNTLKRAAGALGASMLPFSGAFGHSAYPAPPTAPYRRYNASASKTGARMLRSYARAVRAMLALPPEDPRNWYRQAIVHTMDCPHGNWWFLPWHRAYLGWFERICRELSGDPAFALPYWDWTSEQKIPDGMFDEVLDPNHEAFIGTAEDFEQRLGAALAASGYWSMPGESFDRRTQLGQLLVRKLRFDADLMFDIVRDPSGRLFFDRPAARGLRREQPGLSLATSDAVSLATIRAALAAPDYATFGSPKSSNHHTMAGFGILEAKPHNLIHRCVGSRDCNFVDKRGFMADMLSPVDPVFFLHHANIDRLWDVWTRRQQLLGLPYLPDGAGLRTDLPDEEKSPEEKNTDYYRWAREPMLFFVDEHGKPAARTRCGDYEAMDVFGYDYQSGAGEDMARAVVGAPRPRIGRRVFAGRVDARLVQGAGGAGATVPVPPEVLARAGMPGTTLVARITLNFTRMSHDPYIVVLNGTEDPSEVDAASPFYLATIVMFGHHGACGALSYSMPLGERLRRQRADGAIADGALRLRVVPMRSGMGHHGMDDAGAVELLGVEIESY